ncbi:MAG: hypothetical protein E7588_10195 [Ruminococcaceae bacterium]|nr:hypothetical protein [Oscillospiraceae bacterium]
MNAKKLLSILAFALLLCTLLTAFALADSKIIRFDGAQGSIMPTVKASAYHGTVNTDSGLLRVDMANEKLIKDANARANITLSEADYFTLLQYPYIKMKYRTNFPKTLQFYMDADVGGYLVTDKGVGSDDAWTTVKLYYPVHGDKSITVESKVQTYKDDTNTYPYNRYSYTNYGKLSTYTSSPDAKNNKVPEFPSESRPTQIESFFFMLRSLSDSDLAALAESGEDLYMEMEYIAFFETEEEMNAYTSDTYKLISLNNDRNVNFDYTKSLKSSSETGSGREPVSITDDGVYRIDMYKKDLNDVAQQPNANRKTYEVSFSLKEDSYFNLYDYPYAKIKYKTDWTSTAQYYADHYPNTASGVSDRNGYYLGSNSSGAGNRRNTEVTAEFLYKTTDKSTTSVAYTAADGLKWTVGTSSGTKNVLPYYASETDYDLAQMRRFFIQYKGLNTNPEAGGTPTDKDYYLELYYIAYFKDEAAMKAFGAEETAAVEAAKAAVEALELDYVVESADDIEDIITADIEAACGEDVNVEVTFDGENATAHISSFYANRDYTVTKSYTVTELIPAADFGVTVLGAQVRADANDGKGQGLRFGFTIDNAVIPEGCAVVEYGAVIGKNGSEPVLGNTDEYAVVSSAIEEFKFTANGSVNTYTAVVHTIPSTEMDTAIVARPYVTYTLGGSTYTTYGEAVTRSINAVINAATADWDK